MFPKFEEIIATSNEIGEVISTNSYVINVSGLPTARCGEIVVFENNSVGQIMSVGDLHTKIIIFSHDIPSISSKVVRTNSDMSIRINEKMLGAVVNSFGESLFENKPVILEGASHSIDVAGTNIMKRKFINESFITGVPSVDLVLPIGKGQRQLLIGDRKTGKTAFSLQLIKGQINQAVICIYVVIGKKRNDIQHVYDYLSNNNLLSKTIVVAETADSPAGRVYLAPYTGMTFAEYFSSLGKDVLIIFDDLSTHAHFYREISLLLDKLPGRNSYPGDMFYVHSRLLERAGNFDTGSITCFPIATTTEGDLSGYIQTNIMSMTDGHLFFDSDLFYSGNRPAINHSLSVTRVGRQTQTPLRWSINRELNSFLSLYKRTQKFIHFGAELNEGIKATLDTGAKLNLLFTQSANSTLPINLQICIFCILWSGVWNSMSHEDTSSNITNVVTSYNSNNTFRETFDEMILNATDFNGLLKQFMQVYPKIQEELNHYDK